MNRMPFHWAFYQQLRVWSSLESVCLLLKENPVTNGHIIANGGELPDNIAETIKALKKDAIDEKVKAVNYVNGDFYYFPVAILDWADQKGMDVATDLRDFIEILRL